MLVRTTEDELRQEVGEPFEDLGEQFLHKGEKKDEREKKRTSLVNCSVTQGRVLATNCGYSPSSHRYSRRRRFA